METLVIVVLAALQIAGLGFALFLFTRSISGVTRSEAGRATRSVVDILMILLLLGLVMYWFRGWFGFWGIFFLYGTFR